MKTHHIYLALVVVLFLSACTAQRQIGRQAQQQLLTQPHLGSAHVGITIFDPAAKRYLYNHQGDKYFIPASNTKLFTLYAGLRYLGDSIPAAYYLPAGDMLLVRATGDPTFLHPDFSSQPLMQLLKDPRYPTIGLYTPFADKPLGMGWAWDDFNATYMAERDPFPMYGNIATFLFKNDSLYTIPGGLPVAGQPQTGQPWSIQRNLGGQFFIVQNGRGTTGAVKSATMSMERGAFAARFLADTLHKTVVSLSDSLPPGLRQVAYSQPTDSLFKLMMHRSDNFFAEQTLLMVSNQKLQIMNSARIIDTLLKSDLAGLPQTPKWVDGSGLSRYNLFSPQSIVYLLQQIKNNYPFERIKEILPTGNEGTLAGLYPEAVGKIWAKTGTLSNNLALSGYLLTNKGKTLIFSVMVNNHQSSAATIRKSIEAFLMGVIKKY